MGRGPPNSAVSHNIPKQGNILLRRHPNFSERHRIKLKISHYFSMGGGGGDLHFDVKMIENVRQIENVSATTLLDVVPLLAKTLNYPALFSQNSKVGFH